MGTVALNIETISPDVDCRSENVEEKLRRDRAITTEYETTK